MSTSMLGPTTLLPFLPLSSLLVDRLLAHLPRHRFAFVQVKLKLNACSCTFTG